MLDSNDSQPQYGHLLFLIPTSGVWCRLSSAASAPYPGDSHGSRLERENCFKNILVGEWIKARVCFFESLMGKLLMQTNEALLQSVMAPAQRPNSSRLQPISRVVLSNFRGVNQKSHQCS